MQTNLAHIFKYILDIYIDMCEKSKKVYTLQVDILGVRSVA